MKKVLIVFNGLAYLALQFVLNVDLSNNTLELIILFSSVLVCFFSGLIVFKEHWNKAHLATTNYLMSYKVLASILFLLLFISHVFETLQWLPASFNTLEWLVWSSLYFMLTVPVYVEIFKPAEVVKA